MWSVTLLFVLAAVAAIVLPALQVKGVSITRVQWPSTAVVGQRESIGYEVRATGGLKRHGIEIHERLGGDVLEPAAFLPEVGGTQTFTFAWTPQVRGCWHVRDIVIESQYPLGLAKSRRVLPMPEREIIVYPDFVHLPWLPIRNDAHPRFQHAVSPRRGGRDEFFGVRPYRPGDEMRSIHWRSSARLQQFVVKEFEQDQDRQLWIVLELAESQHVGRGIDSTCEYMIRVAHSVVRGALSDDIPVGLIYRTADIIHRVPASADHSTYDRIRDLLARVHAHAQVPLVRWMRRYREQLPTGGTWLMFNLSGAGERAELERVCAQRAAVPLFVEFELESFRAPPFESARVGTNATAHGLVSTVPHGADLTELFRP